MVKQKPRLLDLLNKETKGMSNEEIKKFRHELEEKLPELIEEAAKTAKGQTREEADK